jgi:glycyl-tRNA synthetase beta chain
MIKQADFLLEIGTEELPPLSLKTLAEDLQELLKKKLHKAALSFGATQYFATPRRLAVLVRNLQGKQDDVAEEIKGPLAKIAFDEDGAPNEVCVGFAKSVGTEVESLQQKAFGKETRLVFQAMKKGALTSFLLPQVVDEALKELPIPKPMRWGKGLISFVRPVHSVLMLYGNETISADILGKQSSNKTYGHRFHHPEGIEINSVDDYVKFLEEQGFVVPDFAKRCEMIKQKVMDSSADMGHAEISQNFLEEVAGIVEWPVALIGKFDDRFLQLPAEVLTLALQKQQKCFPLFDADSKDKKILPIFIIISNIESKNPDEVIKGNEKVIRARLSDAEFFNKIDAEFSLESYFDRLKTTVFQVGLGSIFDKTGRVSDLAVLFAQRISANVIHVKRAAELAKSDLMTTMVGEFPELQGIIGCHYALKQGEPNEVAAAIKEQYLPRFSGDLLPETQVGAVLSIVDKIDTLAGNFCLKKIPTGEKDPLGLRRITLGILRIILEKQINFDLEELLRSAIEIYRKQCRDKVLEDFETLIVKNYQIPSQDLEENVNVIIENEVVPRAMSFMSERLRGIYVDEKNIPTTAFNAVLAKNPTRPLDFDKRINAVVHFLSLPEAESLSITQKRVKNILRKAGVNLNDDTYKCNSQLLKEPVEVKLYSELVHKRTVIENHYQNDDYKEIMSLLADLKSSVDSFFDHVMVMVDDKKLKNNRLALLQELHLLFNFVADISELVVQ